MRRSNGAVLGAIMDELTEAGESEVVYVEDLEGLIADGEPLTRKDVRDAMRYLTRVVGVTRKLGQDRWEVVALAAIERARDYEAWAADADIDSAWTTELRRINAGRFPTCPLCHMTLGLNQDPSTCANCN